MPFGNSLIILQWGVNTNTLSWAVIDRVRLQTTRVCRISSRVQFTPSLLCSTLTFLELRPDLQPTALQRVFHSFLPFFVTFVFPAPTKNNIWKSSMVISQVTTILERQMQWIHKPRNLPHLSYKRHRSFFFSICFSTMATQKYSKVIILLRLIMC